MQLDVQLDGRPIFLEGIERLRKDMQPYDVALFDYSANWEDTLKEYLEGHIDYRVRYILTNYKTTIRFHWKRTTDRANEKLLEDDPTEQDFPLRLAVTRKRRRLGWA